MKENTQIRWAKKISEVFNKNLSKTLNDIILEENNIRFKESMAIQRQYLNNPSEELKALEDNMRSSYNHLASARIINFYRTAKPFEYKHRPLNEVK